jgi:hypothetical protein
VGEVAGTSVVVGAVVANGVGVGRPVVAAARAADVGARLVAGDAGGVVAVVVAGATMPSSSAEHDDTASAAASITNPARFVTALARTPPIAGGNRRAGP